ncbi:MAG: hypothetical protein MUF22_04755 [Chitinispirillaceae bacterium]|jgi:tetratricopeptide (TPR) repeat protein|nr:hypothetical protein [Chitinispirillaceae bacterium]
MIPRIIITLVIMTGTALASTRGPGGYYEPCINRIISCDYDGALRIADSAGIDTLDLLAQVLHLAAIGIRNVDFDEIIDSAGFLRTYHSALTRIDKFERLHKTSSYSRMLMGICHAMHSSFYLRQQSYYAAVKTGFTALDCLKDAQSLDSTNTDALLFTGLYSYAKAELRKKLVLVMFWYPGSKEEGIGQLRECSDKGRLSRTVSLFALADIYTREKQPEKASLIIDQLEKEFPKSRFFLWAKAKHLESRKLFYEAALCYDALAVSYAAVPGRSHSVLVTRNRQAHMLTKAGQKKDAAAICELILRKERSTDKRDNIILKDTRKLLRTIHGNKN